MVHLAIHDQQSQSHVSSKTPRYVEGALIPDTDKHGDNPVVIRLTDEERISGKTDPQTIQEILTYYHKDGVTQEVQAETCFLVIVIFV
jgi:hypothetical protein